MAKTSGNKAHWVGDRSVDQAWFTNNVKRQRRRRAIAKQSRRKNRK